MDFIEDFRQILDDPKSTEQEIQDFMEEHSAIIPTPFLQTHQLHENIIISKLPIGNTYVTDFAYLTKCSVRWNLVLIEIEKASKRIFCNSTETASFRKDFNDAYAQIQRWKAFLEEPNHRKNLIEEVKSLMFPIGMAELNVEIKYVLVYGRNFEFNVSKERMDLWRVNTDKDTELKTYDSIISEYIHKSDKSGRMILSPSRGRGFEIKRLPTPYKGNNVFRFMCAGDLNVPNNIETALIEYGYDMASWKNGEFLGSQDGKHTEKYEAEHYDGDSHVLRALYQARLKELQDK